MNIKMRLSQVPFQTRWIPVLASASERVERGVFSPSHFRYPISSRGIELAPYSIQKSLFQ